MTSDAWIILVISGLLSFFVGAWLRRVMNRRRFQRSQDALAQMRSAVAERERQAPASHNKAKRRRQQRSRQADGS
jgi:ABC-type transport system involved in cytochrome bd biosynthesis fused ATPase/permease subunit